MCVVVGKVRRRALARAVPSLVTRLSTLKAETLGRGALFSKVSGFSAVVALQCFRIGNMLLEVLPFSASAGEECLALIIGHVV